MFLCFTRREEALALLEAAQKAEERGSADGEEKKKHKKKHKDKKRKADGPPPAAAEGGVRVACFRRNCTPIWPRYPPIMAHRWIYLIPRIVTRELSHQFEAVSLFCFPGDLQCSARFLLPGHRHPAAR